MSSKRLSTILNFFSAPRAILILAWLSIVATNYQPNTWLIGWDNLLPEIDIFLNLHKTVFAAWQSWQGLGIVGGIGHASELSRQLLLLPFSLLLPTHMVRYIWTFSMLLLGALGTYQLSFWLHKNKPHTQWVALIPALFYIFNLATIQNFFVPLEAFSSFWGFLPWFLLSSFKLISKPTKKHIFGFVVIQFLGASAFHVQTMFIVFSLLLGFFSLITIVQSKGKKILALAVLWITLLLSHFYWLAPVSYFTLTNSDQTIESKQNVISTQEVYEANRAAGSLINILQLKGYWFEYTDVENGETIYLLDEWKKYSEKPLPTVVGIFLSLFAVVGVVGALHSIKDKNQKQYLLFLVFSLAFSISMLSAGKGIQGLGYTFLTKIPLLGQIFRVPFTKWSVVFSLLLALSFGYLLTLLIEKKRKTIALATSIIILGLTIYTVVPLFTGELFYRHTKITFPNEYSQLFTELKNYPDSKRILYLPFDDFWGWMNHTWQYRGSGFIWYGIAQPVIDRNFDVWSVRNESLYGEFQYAFQTKNEQLALELIEKYDISLLLIDTSIEAKSERYQEYTAIISQLEKTQHISKVWESGFLILYEVTNQKEDIIITTSFNTSEQPKRRIVDGLFNQGTYHYSKEATHAYPLQEIFREALKQNEAALQNNLVLVPVENTTLTIPALTQTKQMYGLQIIGNTITIEPIAPLTTLNTSSNTQTIVYPLDSLSIQLDELGKYVYIDINGEIIELKETEYTQVILDERITSPTHIRISNRSDVLPKDTTTLISSNYQEVTIPSEIWSPLFQELQITLNEDEALALSSLTEHLSFSESTNTVENCDALSRGHTEKILNEDSSITYYSSNFGTYCDGKSTTKIQSDRNHFLNIKSINHTGLPLRFYVKNNATNVVLLEHSLQTTDNTFFIPSDSNSGSISVNVQNKSRGTISENTLLHVALHEIPLSLQDMSAIISGQNKNQQIPAIDVTHLKTKSFGNFLYQTSFFIPHENNEISSQSSSIIISLSQSFDSGWVAFTTKSFPETLAHFEMDGWKNGWEVKKGQTTLYIVYWPQITIFAGYLVLIALIISLYKQMHTENSVERTKKARAKQLYRLPKRVLGGKHRRS